MDDIVDNSMEKNSLENSLENSLYTKKEILFSFGPIHDENSKVLILGTMASPASIKAGMYYSHPHNLFWKILEYLTGDSCGSLNVEKKQFLLRNHIALWDTLKSCVRPGSSDNDIRNAVPNDIAALVGGSPRIAAVFLNGSASYKYYVKYHSAGINLPYFRLPSTSPANCGISLDKKRELWGEINKYLY